MSHPNDLPPAVILGGFYPSFSVARGLGRRGIEVHALGESANTLPARSRYVRSFLPVPDRAEERWREWFASGPRGAVVIPCGDSGLEFAAHNRAWLEELGYVPTEADDDVTLAMLDKDRTYELATRAGVDVPGTANVETWDALEAVVDEFEYPCALKPRDSFRFNQLFARKAFVVNSPEELRDAYKLVSETGLQMIVTEIVAGERAEQFEFASYYSYLDEHGEPLFHFTKRKLRQYPLGWGTGTYHVSKWDPDVAGRASLPPGRGPARHRQRRVQEGPPRREVEADRMQPAAHRERHAAAHRRARPRVPGILPRARAADPSSRPVRRRDPSMESHHRLQGAP